jgi:hypothetical protein
MKTLFAAALLSAAALAPSLADAADYPVPRSSYQGSGRLAYGLPYPISFMRNYGPGHEPGAFAYYDGPATNHCYQSAAAYIGQDGRRHPCF